MVLAQHVEQFLGRSGLGECSEAAQVTEETRDVGAVSGEELLTVSTGDEGNHGSGCGGLIGVGSCAPLGSSGLVARVVPVGGTLHNLYVHVSAAPGVGVHNRWATIVNGAGTALGCDIDGAATSCNNTAASLPLSAGDTVWLEATQTTIGGSTPAAVSWAVQAG